MDITTKPAAAATPVPPPAPDFDVERHQEAALDLGDYTNAVSMMDAIATGALDEIAAIAKLVIWHLEGPESEISNGVIADALSAIWIRAEQTSRDVSDAADVVGCAAHDHYFDRCLKRRGARGG